MGSACANPARVAEPRAASSPRSDATENTRARGAGPPPGRQDELSKESMNGEAASENVVKLELRRAWLVVKTRVVHGVTGDPSQYHEEIQQTIREIPEKDKARISVWVDDTLQLGILRLLAEYVGRQRGPLHPLLHHVIRMNRIPSQQHHEDGPLSARNTKDDSSGTSSRITESTNGPTDYASQSSTRSSDAVDASTPESSSRRGGASRRTVSNSTDSNLDDSARHSAAGDAASFQNDPYDVRSTIAPDLWAHVNAPVIVALLNAHARATGRRLDNNNQSVSETSRNSDVSTNNDIMADALASAAATSPDDVTSDTATRTTSENGSSRSKATETQGGENISGLDVDCPLGLFTSQRLPPTVVERIEAIETSSYASTMAEVNSGSVSRRGSDRGGSPSTEASAQSALRPSRGSGGSNAAAKKDDEGQQQQQQQQHHRSKADTTAPRGHRKREHTLFAKNLSAFSKNLSRIIQRVKSEEDALDRKILTCAPGLRQLAFGPVPYSSSIARPWLRHLEESRRKVDAAEHAKREKEKEKQKPRASK